VLALAHRVPFTRRRWPAVLALHGVAAVAFGAAHLAIVFNSGVDDRPVFHMANIDPFTLDLFIYFGLLAWSHARDFAAWYEERGLAAARTEAAIARAHWQTLALELHPQFLLAALGQAADLTRSDGPRAERVVERLADLLRATLDAPSRGARSVREELEILGSCLELHREATGGSAALECVVEATTLDALVPSGAFHHAVDRVLQRACTTRPACCACASRPADAPRERSSWCGAAQRASPHPRRRRHSRPRRGPAAPPDHHSSP